ncbi:hypothetical protein KIPB_003563 [Kipferlia bialata]|uniref:Kelch-type beta propeller n=1 Tax=Kipferlia bialata TaxID=797122 RepID=A0A9K3CT45_9EUKA|nr:hypothetical protein KIPB_003563 [Kipferlia bialata]|eukprot:g3563.t1
MGLPCEWPDAENRSAGYLTTSSDLVDAQTPRRLSPSLSEYLPMERLPWYTDVSTHPAQSKGEVVTNISAASLGENRVMTTTSSMRQGMFHGMGQSVKTSWSILTLSHSDGEPSITSETIPGPPNPKGVCDVQLVRVADTVVAYGSNLPSTAHSDQSGLWFMWVYSIATDKWTEVPYIDGDTPSLRQRPLLFAVGDSLVFRGGVPYAVVRVPKTDTWELSVQTHNWTYKGECDAVVDGLPLLVDLHSGQGSTIGETYHAFKRGLHPEKLLFYHLQYSGGNWDVEPDLWGSSLTGVAYSQHAWQGSASAVSLSDQHQLVIYQKKGEWSWEPVTTECVVRDCISLDVVPLEVLSVDEKLQNATVLLVNPETLLIVCAETYIVMTLDPRVLCRFHSSMVGFHEFCDRERDDSG